MAAREESSAETSYASELKNGIELPTLREKAKDGGNMDELAYPQKKTISDDEISQLPSLERVMLKTFGTFATISMALILGLLVASLLITGYQTENIAQDSIEDVLEDHIVITSSALSAKMHLQLTSLEESVVAFTVNTLKQADNDNSSNILKHQEDKDFASSSDFPNSICPHIGDGRVDRLQNTDLQGNVSLDYSIYATAPNSDFMRDKNSSFIMNYFYRRMWEEHDSLVAMYTSFLESKLLRFYPGICDLSHPSVESRPWFQVPLENNEEKKIAYVGPYRDAFGNGWVLTLSQAVPAAKSSAGEEQQFIAVTAADIVINLLQEDLEVEFFGTRTASMVRLSDGRVVADPYWDGESGTVDPENSDSTTQKLKDIHPGIDETTWQELRDTSEGSKVIKYKGVDGEQWIAGRSFIPPHPDDSFSAPDESPNKWAPRYVVFVEAREEDVLESLTNLKERIGNSTRDLIIGAAALLLAVWLLVLGMVKLFTKRITVPLRRMMWAATAITSQASSESEGQIGEDNDLDINDIPETEDEIGQFVREFKTMVHGFNKGGVKGRNISNYVDNPFFRDGGSKDSPLPWDTVLSDLNISKR